MVVLKNFFDEFFLISFSSWSMAISLVLFVLAIVLLVIAARFEDPKKENAVIMWCKYVGLLCIVLSIVLFCILMFVEFVTLFVFLIGSRIAFNEFAIRLVFIIGILFILIRIMIVDWLDILVCKNNVEFIISHFFFS